MSALWTAAVIAVLVAMLITFGGMAMWLASLAEQADADASVEAMSANKERESFFVSPKEQSS